MKIFILGFLLCTLTPLSAAELKKYSRAYSNSQPPVKTRGIIRNPVLRSLKGRELRSPSDTLTREALNKVDKTIEILSKMDSRKVAQWLGMYQEKLNQAVKSGKITEARYYQAIIEKWRNKKGSNL